MAASKQPFAITTGFNQDPSDAVALCKTCKVQKMAVKRAIQQLGTASDHDLHE